MELKGTQLRIRVKNPSKFKKYSYGTETLGVRGRLQRIAARLKKNNEWEVQAWHLNLNDYKSASDVKKELDVLKDRSSITGPEYRRALMLTRKWFR